MSQQQTLLRTTLHKSAGEAESAQAQGPSHAIDWQSLAPQSYYARKGHRLLDIALLAIVLPLAVVPLTVVALANWIFFRRADQILFKQARVGYQGITFTIIKFRTMHAPTSDSLGSWAAGDDQARVTSLGRILRSTHLDELPQLWNVVRGEMSFIGPRPEMVEIEQWANDHIEGFTERLSIYPGLTGYAQITQGYTSCDVEAYREKLAINRHYRQRMTLRTDLEIVLRTAWWMVRGKGWAWSQEATEPESQDASSRAA